MKVYHEEKGVERTNSKKSKIFRRKLAIKGHKSKVDKRKSAPPNMLLSDLTSKDYEKLEKMASCYLEHNTDETASSDSHDEERLEGVSQTGSSEHNGRPRAASASAMRSISFDEGRSRGESLDSTLSDDGQTANDNGEIEVDEEESLKKDKERAIAVLKRIHPSRVCMLYYKVKSSLSLKQHSRVTNIKFLLTISIHNQEIRVSDCQVELGL